MLGILGIGLLGIWGCGEELGPVRRETNWVRGRVLERGEPLGGGWIEFLPVEGTVGNLRSAPIGKDGRFVADGVAVGVNLVGFVGAPIQIPGGRRFFDSLGTPVRRRISGGGAVDLTIDLYDEFLRRNQALSTTEGKR